jgi:hypothetical protein
MNNPFSHWLIFQRSNQKHAFKIITFMNYIFKNMPVYKLKKPRTFLYFFVFYLQFLYFINIILPFILFLCAGIHFKLIMHILFCMQDSKIRLYLLKIKTKAVMTHAADVKILYFSSDSSKT